MITVSLIVRSMDRPSLRRALASVAAMDAPGIEAEVLVVAACGAGHSPIPASVGPFPTRLVCLGAPLARSEAGNAGLDAARGQFITFLDDDDELLPNQFATLLAEFDADPAVGLVHARSLAVDTRGNPLFLQGGPWIDWQQLTHGFIQPSAMMLRRGLLDQGVRFDEKLEILEDMDLFVQCAQLATFRFVPAPVFRYHVMEGRSGTGRGRNRDDTRIQRALAYLQEKWRDLSLRLSDSPPARIDRARSLIRRADFGTALATLAPLLMLMPGDVNVLNLLGLCQIQLGHFTEASELLHRALEVVPGHSGILENIELLEQRRRGGA